MAPVEFSLDKTESKIADLYGNKLPINFTCLISVKATFVKFTYPKC